MSVLRLKMLVYFHTTNMNNFTTDQGEDMCLQADLEEGNYLPIRNPLYFSDR